MNDSSSYVSRADLGGDRRCDTEAIVPEPEDELFHHEWEPRALALTLAAGASGRWNIDMSRRYRETLADYDDLSYYEIWTAGLERLLVDRGLVSADELRAGRAIDEPAEVRSVLTADRVAATLARGSSTAREASEPARFTVGNRVRTRAGHVDHHTRLPGYASGRVGTVERVHGAHVFADTNAHDLGEQPQWLYTVVFDAAEIWAGAAAGHRVSVDAWEPYLEPVT